ncbi:phosphopantothenoylcysteine decarboxylase domain-containing protein [Bacillus sp. BP-3]|uniref:phosphopantothenoylcysteine decarboxylase domain-containing protein n=1 Tax=Bacillus sp. BP-3 TaxID=3022773 RepID=UPI00232FB21B|nr:phosphopantothenoylcysteine decarboxylase [Bacillus sp. BP-3]MDC2864245.1 phosphopantothenoylcysteine decarboxylase [Bacillus sp. BP-3]
MKGKKVLITSGGCLEKWDEVRGHTNLSTGRMGRFLAEEALKAGASVIYLHGYFAEKPEEANNLSSHCFEGIIDLQDKMKQIITREKVDIVIMAAAGSDWVVDKIVDQEGNVMDKLGKLSSDIPPIIHFKKAPKVLAQIKQWDPGVMLVGFKLESGISQQELITRAQIRMEGAQADFMVANASNALYTFETNHYIITRDGEVQVCPGKANTARSLISKLAMIDSEKEQVVIH